MEESEESMQASNGLVADAPETPAPGTETAMLCPNCQRTRCACASLEMGSADRRDLARNRMMLDGWEGERGDLPLHVGGPLAVALSERRKMKVGDCKKKKKGGRK